MRLTAKRLRELLNYDPLTGLFTWTEARQWNLDGKPAGWREKNGRIVYIRIEIDRHKYLAHVLAWLYVTGEWPKSSIDHIDHDGTNNRLSNLRLASWSQNHANRTVQATNTSGFKGVSFYKPTGKWQATIGKDKVRRHLGYFGTPEEAHFAYCEAAQRLFGEFARFE